MMELKELSSQTQVSGMRGIYFAWKYQFQSLFLVWSFVCISLFMGDLASPQGEL